MPRISVLMATYNNASYIGECIDSVLSQTFDDFEFIVVNDASTDNTNVILQQYTDPRLRILQNSVNLKLSASLNRGLEIAEGDYIARIDSDDICMSDRFEKQVAFLESHQEIGAVGTQVRNISPDGTHSRPGSPTPTTPNMTSWQVLLGYPVAHPTLMIRRSLLNEVGGYDTSYPYAQDQALWSKLIFKTRLTNLNEVLVSYRQHELSSLNRIKDKQQYELKARCGAIAKLLDLVISTEDLHSLYWSEIKSQYYPKWKYEAAGQILVKLYTAMLQQEVLTYDDEVGLECVQRDLQDRLTNMAYSNGLEVLKWQLGRFVIAPVKKQVYQLRQKRLLSNKR